MSVAGTIGAAIRSRRGMALLDIAALTGVIVLPGALTIALAVCAILANILSMMMDLDDHLRRSGSGRRDRSR